MEQTVKQLEQIVGKLLIEIDVLKTGKREKQVVSKSGGQDHEGTGSSIPQIGRE